MSTLSASEAARCHRPIEVILNSPGRNTNGNAFARLVSPSWGNTFILHFWNGSLRSIMWHDSEPWGAGLYARRASMAKKRSGHSLSPCCSVEWLCVMFIAGANFIRLCSVGLGSAGGCGVGWRTRVVENGTSTWRVAVVSPRRAPGLPCLHPPPSALRLSRHDTNYRFLALPAYCLIIYAWLRPTSLCRVEFYSLSSLCGDALARSRSSIHSNLIRKAPHFHGVGMPSTLIDSTRSW